MDSTDGTTPGDTYVKYSSLERLQERSFGGEDVAARPGSEDDEWWPCAPLLPGVDTVITWLLERRDEVQGLRLIFLLGGAGNGKSFAARELGRRAGITIDPSDRLAHRIYSTKHAGERVEILNDATIAPRSAYGDRQSVALADDIQRWLELSASECVTAFCCVNRGIIIDEIRAIANGKLVVNPLSKGILEWLATTSEVPLSISGWDPSSGDGPAISREYREAWLVQGERQCYVGALAVDGCSLFEQEGVNAAEPRALNLFRQVVTKCQSLVAERPEDCPVRANVVQWTYPLAAERWALALECAEIASSHYHSYRELWGAIALSISGPRVSTGPTHMTPVEYIDARLAVARESPSLETQLLAYLDLARYRTHVALFRSPIPAGPQFAAEYPATTPVHGGLSLVDPSSWWSKHSVAIEFSMHGIALGERPSAELAKCGLLGAGWSGFDSALEEALLAVVWGESCPDVVRRRLISWYSSYLLRYVGLSSGELGSEQVVALWRECARLCADGPTSPPMMLERSLRALLFPAHENSIPEFGNKWMLVPAFALRVEPIKRSRDGHGPLLAEAITHDTLSLRVRRSGPRLLLECVSLGDSRVVGQLALDFHSLREALACHEDRPGETESTTYVEPRIERCRASALGGLPPAQRRLVALSGTTLVELRL